MTPRLLLVDDVRSNLDVLGELLEPEGYEILAAADGDSALRVAAQAPPDLVLLDVMMEGLDGYEVCRRLKAQPATRHVPVVFVTAREDVESLVRGLEAGGVDYITKPFRREEVLARVRVHLENAALTRRLLAEIERREQAEDALDTSDRRRSLLERRESERWGVAGLVGRSRTIAKLVDDVRRLQDFGSTSVLITGESGTGKELIARGVHESSPRRGRTFLPVNCSAVPTELAESLFFGHVAGAFTGAGGERKGYFELADGGTLFLDEIADMPLPLQAKLLRVLEDGGYLPIGGRGERRADVRVIAATNADLPARIEAGTFRRDLYFRLARFTVSCPPLRERREDVPLLAEHFLSVFAKEMGRKPPRLSTAAFDALARHLFPGNVRELKNVMERALIESGGADIGPEHLHGLETRATRPLPAAETVAAPGLPLNLDQAEELLIDQALAQTEGNIAEAARRLGIHRTRIYRRLAARRTKA